MKKVDLILAVKEIAGLETRVQAERAVDGVFDTIVKTLARGENVGITGFGVFTIRKRAARTGRNPQTGEPIQIKAATKPKFRPGRTLKDAVA